MSQQQEQPPAVPGGPGAVEVGLRLAPRMGSAGAVARELVAELHQPGPPRRLIGLGTEGARVVITLAVGLGSAADVRAGAPQSRDAVIYLHDLVERLAFTDPALVSFPDSASVDAVIAQHVETQARAYGLGPEVDRIRGEALLQAVDALTGVGVAVEP